METFLRSHSLYLHIISVFSYVLSQKHGYKEKDYLKPSSYNQSPDKQRQIGDLLRKMKRIKYN